MAPSTTSKLFTPLQLGGKTNPIQLQHRVAMAPLTRRRTGDAGVHSQLGATYYKQRATQGGLIISEATNISPTARGYIGTPGIFNQDQIDGWKLVTKAVHEEGGVMFMQLWHTGRLSHPALQPNNVLPVSSSADMPLDEKRVVPTKDGPLPLVRPRALETEEIPQIVEAYRQAAVNAIAAGFDGVEVHAANGYLLEQFLFDGINQRTDKYGGSVENRARFLFEVLDAILTSVDSSKVGVRLSPYNKSCNQQDSNPAATYTYVFKKLNDYDLAYAHIIEPRGRHYRHELTPAEGATAFFRKIYKGVLISASGYDRESAMETVEAGTADIVAIGRYFISNPDLVKRLELNAPLTTFDDHSFYGVDGKPALGYTDYPFLAEVEVQTS
ncbi:hypothetical protein Poli38472_012114 [Pythium oligandrum]|uniref:NADH:flavin oxidoreductase/NADH oxidase N-terminal domain-containing protein n=1 Tax=Pythium oligandrum TaxID=41045 RepID=A0A8K1CRH5_PYTOL|nr:hypothetical protein Poli38472_012114 [Pythium oligandrum]|eukprot:TMW66998.1 hypothetical protein Poli38472_012114 [Pythium oligandrum]